MLMGVDYSHLRCNWLLGGNRDRKQGKDGCTPFYKDTQIMNIKIKLILISITICLLTSCYTTQYSYQSLEPEYNSFYKNWTKTQIVNKCGAPDRIMPIEGKSEILVYESYKTLVMNVDDFGFAKNKRNYTEFYIGKDSRCYQVKTNATKTIEYTEKDSEATSCAVLGGILGTILLIGLCCL